ncbi:MAG: hypothetical protein R3C68_18070 [Myxococcota bacterium]
MAHSRQRRPSTQGSQELQEIRNQLVKKPESVDLLVRLSRTAMGLGDYYLAKLTFSKAAETDPNAGVIHNLLGVAQWQLGDYQAAYGAFEQAREEGVREASANQAALLHQFGYTDDARATLKGAGDIAGLNSSDLHPGVKTFMLQMGGT